MREQAAEVAREAVAAGADVLAERYGAVDGDLDATFHETDVKAAADVAAEQAILPVLREAFPEHAIYAEESGDHDGDVEYRWIVDPLDGTNNFATGLPTFSTAVALERTGVGERTDVGEQGDGGERATAGERGGAASEPLVAAARLPATDEEYVAVRGDGLYYGGERVTATCERSLATATVATVVGRPVLTDPELAARADALFDPLADACKRQFDTWAPTVFWGLLGRGRVEAVVAVHPDEEEQVLGELFARESGAATWRGSVLSNDVSENSSGERSESGGGRQSGAMPTSSDERRESDGGEPSVTDRTSSGERSESDGEVFVAAATDALLDGVRDALGE